MNKLGWTFLGVALAAFSALAGFALDLLPTPAGSQRPAKVIVTFDSEAEALKEQLARISLERDRLAADLSAAEADQEALLEDLTHALTEHDRLRRRLEQVETRVAETEIQPAPTTGTGGPPEPLTDATAEPLLVPEAGPAESALPGPVNHMDQGLEAYRGNDFLRAFDAWMPLAQAGNPRAQFFIGGLYNDGSGVPRDLVEAYVWLRRSDRGGYRRAETLLASVVQRMTAVEIGLAESRLARASF